MRNEMNAEGGSTTLEIERHQRGTRLRIALGTLMVLGALTAGYVFAGKGGSPSPSHSSVVGATSVTTTTVAPTTTTTHVSLANCGSPRDPFDPTNAGPPAGSPAIC